MFRARLNRKQGSRRKNRGPRLGRRVPAVVVPARGPRRLGLRVPAVALSRRGHVRREARRGRIPAGGRSRQAGGRVRRPRQGCVLAAARRRSGGAAPGWWKGGGGAAVDSGAAPGADRRRREENRLCAQKGRAQID